MKDEVLVIGGGVIGLCVARELQTAGLSVSLIDRGAIGTGCSFANAGWLTPCFAMPLPQPGMMLKSLRWLLDSSSPLHIQPQPSLRLLHWLWNFHRASNRRQMLRSIEVLVALSHYTLDFFAALAGRTPRTAAGPLQFERRGLLMVSGEAAGVDSIRTEMDLMAGRGVAGRELDRDELLAVEPVLRPIVRGGVLFPDEAQIDPFRASLAIAAEFEAAGGRLLPAAEVYDFTVRRGPGAPSITEVMTTQGTLNPQLVVLATGSWSPALARRIGLRVPILGGKGYSMTVEGVSRRPLRPIMIVDRKIAVTPFPDRLRVAGTLELVDQDRGISVSRLQGIRRGTHEYLDLGSPGSAEERAPGSDSFLPVRDVWRGLRPCTPDGVPLIGPSGRIANLVYCTGHQMLGLQTAPGSARLAADLMFGRPPLTDPAPFCPRRFE